MKTALLASLLIAAQLHGLATATAADEGYIAHEWGTFTSVQGADGRQVNWNPFVDAELPAFVHGQRLPAGTTFSRSDRMKGMFWARQRLETPVIYFYSDQERDVQVRVNFPEGLITEWYPQSRPANPTNAPIGISPLSASMMGMLSSSATAPAVNFANTMEWPVHILPPGARANTGHPLPQESSGSHYYAAREAGANLIQTKTMAPAETEKFIFYRGVGEFSAPLNVTMADDRHVALSNACAAPLASLFVLYVHQGRGKFMPVTELKAGEVKPLPLDTDYDLLPLPQLTESLAARMHAALVQQGLYPLEATAMVNTWRDSWFQEEGLRVLYTLPAAWTDQVLPITFTPSPNKIARVMVGRAEMITPIAENTLKDQVTHYADGNAEARARAVQNVRELGLGRFLEPAMMRMMDGTTNGNFINSTRELLQVMRDKSPRS